MARDYRKIKAWQLAHQLALSVYKVTRGFPRSELWGLTSQMRRAAVSVPANIVEGAARQHQKEYLQFLYVAMSSLSELGYYITFCYDVGYAKKEEVKALQAKYEEAARVLRGLIKCIEKSQV